MHKIHEHAHKIIILEGVDKVGKTSIIQKLKEHYVSLSFDFVTISSNVTSYPYIEANYNDDHNFDESFKNVPILFDTMSTNLFYHSIWCKRLLDCATKPTVIVFDRLQLSSLVFGFLLRRKMFLQIWETVDNYVNYMNTFERRLDHYVETHLITYVKTDNSEYVDDNDNEFISITAGEQKESNLNFIRYHEKLSVLENKHLVVCEKDENGWYNSWEQTKKILSII